MSVRKGLEYDLGKIKNDMLFVNQHMDQVDLNKFEDDEVQIVVCFKLIQISENVSKLSQAIKDNTDETPWYKISGLRK